MARSSHVYETELQTFCDLIQSTEVEESQQLENSTGPEAAGLFAEQEQQLTRSSSASDLTDQFPSDFFQGNLAWLWRGSTAAGNLRAVCAFVSSSSHFLSKYIAGILLKEVFLRHCRPQMQGGTFYKTGG